MFFFNFTKGDNFDGFLFASLDDPRSPFKMGSIIKGKNLLLWEQILSFKNLPHCKGDKNENERVASHAPYLFTYFSFDTYDLAPRLYNFFHAQLS